VWGPDGGRAGRGYGRGVWRTALRPRWLALLALVLLVATGMAWLGNWQLGRAREQGGEAARERLAAAPVPLSSLLAPRTAYLQAAVDRPVTVEGRWDGARQLLLPGRRLHGQEGYWVLTPLLLPDGSGIGVVRGWAATVGAARDGVADLPSGTVTVTGVLRPAEDPVDRGPGESSGLPADQLESIDQVELLDRWPDLIPYTGYVLATDPAPSGLSSIPPTSGSGRLALQNLSYAVQWWLFAAFGVFFWYRLVRDDRRGLLEARGTDPCAEGAGLTP